MNKTNNQYILRIVNCIEQSLALNDETCGDVNQYMYPASRKKMYTDFISAVGFSPNEYIRRRRLSIALSMLNAKNINGTNAAYTFGYSSHQAFCREVKAILGMTITEYMNSEVQYYFPPYEDSTVLSVTVKQTIIPETVELFYFSSCLSDIESRATRLFLSNNPTYTGRIFGRNGKQTGSKFCYKLYVEKNSEHINIEGFVFSRIQEGYTVKIAAVSICNNKEEIDSAWNWLYHSWLPTSMYCYKGVNKDDFTSQYFEEYLYKKGKLKPYRLKLCLPVERKEGFIKISLAPYKAKFLTHTEKGMFAERKASEQIIKYITAKYSYALVKPTQLILIPDGNSCTCGMRISNHIEIDDDCFKSIKIHSLCAILDMDGICDPDEMKIFMNRWMNENHVTKKQEPVIIYIYKDEEIKMQLIFPVNLT